MSREKVNLERILVGIPNLLWLIEVGVGCGKKSHPARLDYLAGCANSDTCLRLKETENYLNSVQAGSVSISDDAVCCIFQSKSVTVAVCDSQSLQLQLKGYREGLRISGEHRPWANGYWIPEALCADLAFCQICHDPFGEANRLSTSFASYPSPLSEAIVKLCRQEIKAKLPALLSVGNPIEQTLAKADVVASLIRLAFATDHQYLRGFQHLDLQAQQLSSRAFGIYQVSKVLAGLEVPIQQELYQTIEVINAENDSE